MDKTKTEQNKITAINEEYFGKDKSKNYLKHDFIRVLEGFIQREVLLCVIVACSKKRHNMKESKNEVGEVVSITYGDYDPDNAGFLYSVFKNHELGVIIDMRLLLAKKEAGTGGKFVKDVTKLKAEDFLDYYRHSEEGKVVIPALLLRQFLENHKDNVKLSGSDFLDKHIDKIGDKVRELVNKASTFNDTNYSDMIIKDYEALKFHKDNQPEKYEVLEDNEGIGAFSFTKTTRRDKSKVETIKISKALNEFVEIIALYQMLVSENTSFYGSSWPLDTYVQRTFALFRKDTPTVAQQKVTDSVAKHLSQALNVTGWRITDNQRSLK
jgi:hypothetical protein